MKKKCLIFFILCVLLLVPFTAYANIKCNDGTVSPSCTSCGPGCCSHHNGCTSDPQNNSSNGKSSTTSHKDYKEEKVEGLSDEDYKIKKEYLKISFCLPFLPIIFLYVYVKRNGVDL